MIVMMPTYNDIHENGDVCKFGVQALLLVCAGTGLASMLSREKAAGGKGCPSLPGSFENNRLSQRKVGQGKTPVIALKREGGSNCQ